LACVHNNKFVSATNIQTNIKTNMVCNITKKKVLIDSTRVYPKVYGLAFWSENFKRYSSLPLVSVVSLFCESVYRLFAAITLCVDSQRVFIVVISLRLSPETFGYTLVYALLGVNFSIFCC
jgi:hypothetical protein